MMRLLFILMLLALAVVPVAASGPSFADVSPGHWAYAQIEQVYAAGITAGCVTSSDPATRLYCPDAATTRASMAVFLVRAQHGGGYVPPAPVGLFSDVSPGHWAARFIEQLYNDGITSGCAPSSDPATRQFCPDATVTRAQMAVFLLRVKYGAGYVPPAATGDVFNDVAGHWAQAWIEQMYRDGLTSGCVTSSDPATRQFCPDAVVDRAQAAVFVARVLP